MLSIDAVLLGIVVLVIVASIPIGIFAAGVLFWGARPVKARRHSSE